jgi:hypothetical protein
MARHETEMHRQRRELFDTMREICRLANATEYEPSIRLNMILGTALSVLIPAGETDRQLDFADRQDLKR